MESLIFWGLCASAYIVAAIPFVCSYIGKRRNGKLHRHQKTFFIK